MSCCFSGVLPFKSRAQSFSPASLMHLDGIQGTHRSPIVIKSCERRQIVDVSTLDSGRSPIAFRTHSPPIFST